MPQKVNKYKKCSFKPSLAFNACSPARDLAAAVFPPLGPEAQRLGRAQPARFTARHEYLNLEWFHSCSFKERVYQLTYSDT
jgi:hypothetical protein